MSGRRVLTCLLCDNDVSAKKLLKHICGHIQYTPQKCGDCNYKSIERSDLFQHTVDTGHVGNSSINPYKESLLDSISKDIQFAAKHGVEELMKRKNSGARSLASPSTASSSVARPRDRQPAAWRRSTSPEESSSSDEEEEPPLRSVNQTPPKKAEEPKRKNDNKPAEPTKKPRKNSEKGESEDVDEDEIAKLRNEMRRKYARCNLCRRNNVIPSSLRHRMDHMKDVHMDNWEAMRRHPKESFEDVVERKTAEAFPGLVSSRNECAVPCCRKTILTTGGRNNHVITYHKNYFKPLACPTGCGFQSLSERDFTYHFMDKHGTPKNWRLFIEQTDFIGTMNLHKRKIEQVVDLLFTVPFAQNPAVKRRRSGGQGDDEDEEETRKALAALRAAPPSGPAGPLSAPKRPRSKSVSSSEDEEDSDENEGVQVMSIKKKPNGNVASRNADTSDIDDEDDKEQARNGPTAGSLCATVASNPDEANKTPAVIKKEVEIKEEPVDSGYDQTPSTRARPPTGFTGRRLPPVSPHTPNLYPSAEQAAMLRQQQRREQQWGRGRGGGGRGGYNSGGRYGNGGQQRHY